MKRLLARVAGAAAIIACLATVAVPKARAAGVALAPTAADQWFARGRFDGEVGGNALEFTIERGRVVEIFNQYGD